MSIKIYKPFNPGLRRTSVVKDATLSRSRPEKSLVMSRKQKAGRNNTGRITVRHRGGGAKRLIRVIDFKHDKHDIPARVASLEYDPNRNARIALLVYADGAKRYMLAPEGLAVGMTIQTTKTKKIAMTAGNRMTLKMIPTGTAVYNIEMVPGRGGQLARAAGNAASLMALDGGRAQLKMPSGEIRLVSDQCLATIGVPSNIEYRNIRWGKAGRMRHRGIRPTVRGKAMNPVDHPHGGGEGRHPIGMKHPKTYKGKPALGVRTRKVHLKSSRMIVSRRKK